MPRTAGSFTRPKRLMPKATRYPSTSRASAGADNDRSFEKRQHPSSRATSACPIPSMESGSNPYGWGILQAITFRDGSGYPTTAEAGLPTWSRHAEPDRFVNENPVGSLTIANCRNGKATNGRFIASAKYIAKGQTSVGSYSTP